MTHPLHTVRFKFLSVLLIVVIGFLVLVINYYTTNQRQQIISQQVTQLYNSRAQLDELNQLITDNALLLVHALYHGEIEEAEQLLTRNQQILTQFDAFRRNAESNGLTEDIRLAEEKATTIVDLRQQFYQLALQARNGQIEAAQDQFEYVLDKQVEPLLDVLGNSRQHHDDRIQSFTVELVTTQQSIARTSAVILTATLLLMIGAMLLIARSVVMPLLHLREAVEQITREPDLATRAPIESKDETADLARAFNLMIEKLQNAEAARAELVQQLALTNARLHSDSSKRESLIQQLSEKNAELERFTYTVSHDLKSPLVTIKGFIGLLKRDINEQHVDNIEKDLAQIDSAADKMAILLDDLLELSRIGRVVNAPQEFGLTLLFQEVVDLLRAQVLDTDATVVIEPNMPTVTADRQRMREVALNLLDNALKFHQPDETPYIRVSASVRHREIHCCVSDNGIGIEPAYHEQIFGLFDRLDPDAEGTGIGLALVKRIIDVHNGEITVSSKGSGHGSTFCFTLPQHYEDSA